MPLAAAQRDRVRQAWTDPDSLAFTLITLFLDSYGTEGLRWDPVTIVAEIEDDFRVALPQLCADRLMVAIQLLTTDVFYKSLPDFIQFCNVLGGTPFNPQLWDPADELEVAWGITEALLISPPDDDDEEPFSDEIRAYIGAVLDERGMMNAPDILRIALRDPQLAANVQGDFSDDPEMFGAIYDFEADKTNDVNNAVRNGLRAMRTQVQDLPLNTGNTQNFSELLRKHST